MPLEHDLRALQTNCHAQSPGAQQALATWWRANCPPGTRVRFWEEALPEAGARFGVTVGNAAVLAGSAITLLAGEQGHFRIECLELLDHDA